MSNGKDGTRAEPRRSASQAGRASDAGRPLLPPRGDYQTLLSFQKAEVVYDITFRFAHKYLSRGDRTVDPMIQSARSGKKNILEGSKAWLTSKMTEIELTNVTRASLEELLLVCRDFLRERMTRARLDASSASRNRSHTSQSSHPPHSSHGHPRGRGKPNLPSNERQGEENGKRK